MMITRQQNQQAIERLAFCVQNSFIDSETQAAGTAYYAAKIMEALLSGDLSSIPVVS